MSPKQTPEQKLEVSGSLNVTDRPEHRRGKELKGILNPNLVRVISFVVITVSLVASTVLCIWAIWSNDVADTVWRAIATFIVVIIATAIFTFVNEKLG